MTRSNLGTDVEVQLLGVRGRLAVENGDRETARRLFEAALNLDTNFLTWEWRFRLYLLEADFDGARRLLDGHRCMPLGAVVKHLPDVNDRKLSVA